MKSVPVNPARVNFFKFPGRMYLSWPVRFIYEVQKSKQTYMRRRDMPEAATVKGVAHGNHLPE